MILKTVWEFLVASVMSRKKTTLGLDYASDAKPEKQIARRMMIMTVGINKKYFGLKHPLIGRSILAITCVTCHNGQPRPGDLEEK